MLFSATARNIGVIVVAFVGGYLIVGSAFKFLGSGKQDDPFDKDHLDALRLGETSDLVAIRAAFRTGLAEQCERYAQAENEMERDDIDRTVCRMADAYDYFRRKLKSK